MKKGLYKNIFYNILVKREEMLLLHLSTENRIFQRIVFSVCADDSEDP